MEDTELSHSGDRDHRTLSHDRTAESEDGGNAVLASVLEAVSDVVLLLDDEGVIEGANDAVSEVLGYDRGALRGRHVDDLLSPLDGEGFSASSLLERTGAGDGVTGVVAGFEAADGRTVPVELSASPVREAGAVSGSVWAATDVRERKRRQRELERSRERTRALFENNQVIVLVFDLSDAVSVARELADGVEDFAAYLKRNPSQHERILERVQITDVNGTAVEFYGAESRSDLVENFDETVTDDGFESWRKLWAVLVEGGSNFRTECTARTLDGEVRTVLSETVMPRSHDESTVYFTALDVTERVRQKRELERKKEFLDEFASVVSHDLAAPLGTIENQAQLVELTGEPSHVEEIYEATDRIREMTDELLALARQGKRVGDTDPVDVASVTRDAWGSVDPGGASLSVDADGRVEANRESLRQLLENLLRNCVEHGATDRTVADGGDGRAAPGEGSVSVTVGTFEGGFFVADDGPGIPDSDREAVFEQGYTTSSDGTGLGLAIVARIAEAHGWSVAATESESGGARFEVRTGEHTGDRRRG